MTREFWASNTRESGCTLKFCYVQQADNDAASTNGEPFKAVVQFLGSISSSQVYCGRFSTLLSWPKGIT